MWGILANSNTDTKKDSSGDDIVSYINMQQESEYETTK